MNDIILPIILGVIASGGVWTLIQYLIQRKDTIKEDIKAIKEDQTAIRAEVKAVYETIDRNEAQRARTQILRFGDELYMGKLHTKEHFDEILAACDSYNKFCDTHPDFENMRTVKAQKRISDVYDKCNREQSFLDSKEE